MAPRSGVLFMLAACGLFVAGASLAPQISSQVIALQPPAPPPMGATLNGADAPQPPDFELPAEIHGSPASFIPVRPKTKGKYIVYFPLDNGLQVFPSDMLSNKTQTVVTAASSGRYRLLAYSCVNNVPTLPAVCTIIVGTAPVPPVVPPVVPPDVPPVIPPDPATDPFWSTVLAAYKGDAPFTGPEKNLAAAKYVAYYRKAAAAVAISKATTQDQMWLEVSAIQKAAGINLDALKGCRAILTGEFNRVLPMPTNGANPPPLTDAVKTQIATLYLRFASMIEAAALQ